MTKKIVTLDEFNEHRLKRQLVRERKEDAQARGLNRSAAAELSYAIAFEAARQEDTLFFAGLPDHHYGREMLQRTPQFAFLRSIFDDNMAKAMVHEQLGGIKDTKARSFWTFPGNNKEAFFVTPAHIARTVDMALWLGKHKGADFAAADSEGHLPLYFAAKYTRDPLLIPYLCTEFNISANDSGHDERGRPHDAPIYRAIEAGNVYAVKGLERLAYLGANLNLRGHIYNQTPLIYAVLIANQAVNDYVRGRENAAVLCRRLWIVRQLAASPTVDIDHRDATKWDAKDYAVDPAVAKALAAGIARRPARPAGYQHKPAP